MTDDTELLKIFIWAKAGFNECLRKTTHTKLNVILELTINIDYTAFEFLWSPEVS